MNYNSVEIGPFYYTEIESKKGHELWIKRKVKTMKGT
jgi:hypothetical protein